MQEAFQPGSTPAQPGKGRFLCYNILESITTMKHDESSHIEIDFHDSGRGPKIPAMIDRFGFTMASLNENGSVFANLCNEKNMSTLMYRPFKSWANNNEWSMRFEEEEVRAIALGSSWVAAVTNSISFALGGLLQRHVVYLDGPVVTASGFGDDLEVVTYSYTIIHLDKNRIFSITCCSADNRYKNGRRKFSTLETSVNDVEGVGRVESEAKKEAWRLLKEAVVTYCGNHVGTMAANDLNDKMPLNYD